MKDLNERSKKNLAGIHPDLVKVMECAITDSPVGFTVTSGVRTLEEQQKLYAQGRTAAGKIVTNADGIKNRSNHQARQDGYGYAVDLYPHTGPAGQINVNDAAGLTKIAGHIKTVSAGLGIKIQWGGDWKMKDYPHFELVK